MTKQLLSMLLCACIFGCGGRQPDDQPKVSHTNTVFADKNTANAAAVKLQQSETQVITGALVSTELQASAYAKTETPQTASNPRFKPATRLAEPLERAINIRKQNGYKDGDDFPLNDALSVGETLHREWPELVPLDEKQLAAQGIRVIKSRHLALYTDVPASPAVDELPAVFDLAVVEYGRYFGVDLKNYDAWQMRGFLIADLQKFRAANLIGDYPTQLAGFSKEKQLWVKEQPNDYYRRHLIIHEGVHGFMNWTFGTCGPPWYMEAIAEYLGTHNWHDGKLTLGVMPKNRESVGSWGRVDLLKKAVDDNKVKSLDQILRMTGQEIITPSDYAWVWALGYLLDNHSRYQSVFRKMPRWLTFPDFTNRFYLQLEKQWGMLQLDWYNEIANLEYNDGSTQAAINYKIGTPLSKLNDNKSVPFDVDATQSWQCSGVLLEAGKTYRIKASGRYQLGKEPKIWYSEPNGVTVRYYRQKPLGVLIAVVLSDDLLGGEHEPTINDVPFFEPITIGTETVVTPNKSGTLYFCINDSSAELSDNAGTCQVVITEE